MKDPTEAQYQIKEITDKTLTTNNLEILYYLLKDQLSSSITHVGITQALSSSQCVILAAFEKDMLIGTATLAYSYCVTGTRAHIEDVVVDSEHQGKGIGTRLIHEATQRAKILKAKSIDLTSRPDREAANRLYRKLGFVQRETNVYRYVSP